MTASAERRQSLLREVNHRLSTTGLTREEFARMKNYLVSPGWTVEDFVYAQIDFLEVKIVGEKFITNLNRTRTLDLDRETEELLRRKIAETGKSANALMLEFIQAALQAN